MWISGSTCRKRALGSSARIASMPSSAARTRRHFASQPTSRCGAPRTLALVGLAPIRMDQIGLRDRPGEKADLVDRRVDRHGVGAAAQGARRGAGELGEAVGKVVLEQVDVFRSAVVHQRPQQLQAVPRSRPRRSAARARSRSAAGAAAAAHAVRFGDAPADAFAHAAQAERGDAPVVLVDAIEVAVRAHQVERRAVRVAMVCAFEARHPEGSIGSVEIGGG